MKNSKVIVTDIVELVLSAAVLISNKAFDKAYTLDYDKTLYRFTPNKGTFLVDILPYDTCLWNRIGVVDSIDIFVDILEAIGVYNDNEIGRVL